MSNRKNRSLAKRPLEPHDLTFHITRLRLDYRVMIIHKPSTEMGYSTGPDRRLVVDQAVRELEKKIRKYIK